MSSLGERTRFAILLAVGATLTVAGLVTWVSEITPLRLGQPNASGAQTTEIGGSSAQSVFRVDQRGTGSAIHGTLGAGAAADGFTSATGAAVLGVAGDPDRVGIQAANAATTPGGGAALHAAGGQNSAILAASDTATTILAAGYGNGKAAIHAVDRSADDSGYAIVATGDASVVGGLAVTDGCVGCTSMLHAINGSSMALEQGQAVALDGLGIGQNGSTVVVVRPAAPGEQVIGIVDRGLVVAASSDQRTGIRPKWQDGHTVAGPGAALRIAIDGVLTLDGELPGIREGMLLAVARTPGDLEPFQDGLLSVGRYLGVRPDGRGVILVDIDQVE